MSRQEKKSRRKFLPVRVQLNELNSLSGSFPTKSKRIASDGTIGFYPTAFNDNSTIVFQNCPNIVYGTQLNSGSLFITTASLDSNNETSIAFTGPGKIEKGVVDSNPLVTLSTKFSSGSQALKPFRDSSNHATDGKGKNVSFYATGSSIEAVGEGFNQPLWSKTKIEIDLSVAKQCSIECIPNTSASGYPMGYYNFESRVWEGIGVGVDTTNVSSRTYTSTNNVLETAPVGFAPSMHIPYTGEALVKAGGHPISQFGFPFDVKFHATSSQLVSMKKYINTPFLLEKIVLEVSCAFSGNFTGFANGTLSRSPFLPIAANTFFICNQFNNEKINNQPYGSLGTLATAGTLTLFMNRTNIPSSSVVSKGGFSQYINTVRELVTYHNIMSVGSDVSASYANTNIVTPQQDYSREYNHLTSVPGIQGTFFGPRKFTVSGSVVSPVGPTIDTFVSFMCITSSNFEEAYLRLANGVAFASSLNQSFTPEKFGTRSGLGLERHSTRDFRGGFFQNKTMTEFQETIISNPLIRPSYVNQFSFVNPYYIMPEDNLIFGWQLPLSIYAYVTSSSDSFIKTTFYPGDAKITFYGSMISNGKEYHQTSNQLLSSVAIHEEIGE